MFFVKLLVEGWQRAPSWSMAVFTADGGAAGPGGGCQTGVGGQVAGGGKGRAVTDLVRAERSP
jgi:hypothetical protein